ncbi:MAG: hypothetical protein ACPGRX_04980 [Bdellovibrionales bacterium]
MDIQSYYQNAQSLSGTTKTKTSTSEERFLDYMQQTPTERWRKQILKQLGYTEESLAALSPRKRQAVEEKIQQLVDAKAEEITEEKKARALTGRF